MNLCNYTRQQNRKKEEDIVTNKILMRGQEVINKIKSVGGGCSLVANDVDGKS